ncbi:cilia- and flagella-associated protein 43 isoform X1 [Hemitrygon akajei]|uniref:cilia- and flagella-associated protein 43 isoform X1 n=1 Tax=Hemitrygon akajei TaxID=2704970 RepID=UPI003BF99DF3
MENPEVLSLRWVKGYTSQRVLFVNNNTICYPCGNFIIFINVETKEETVLKCETGSIGAFTTNSNSEIVAFAEQKLKPSIYLYSFPELTKTAVLADGAELEYTLLDFCYSGSYFASFSSIPDFLLTIWNWRTGSRLCSESVMRMKADILCFNPMNQLQLCLASSNCLLLWNIERCNDLHILKQVNIKLPAEDGSTTFSEDFSISPDCSALTYYGPKMLISTEAGLVGDMAKTFVPQELQKAVVQPVSICWTPTSNLYVGCEKGHLLQVDPEMHKAVLLGIPSFEQSSDDRMEKLVSTIKLTTYSKLQPHSVNTLALNTRGLFTAGKDGKLYCIKVKSQTLEVEECWSTNTPIRNITFSADYKSLLIATEEGSAYLYSPSEQTDVSTVLNVYNGDFVSAAFLGSGMEYCVSARKLGTMQVWSLVDGNNISTLVLSEMISAMACCPSSSHVALGTETGHIYYANLVTVERPHVVYQVYLHGKPIQVLQYDQEGQILVAGCTDGLIFVMNAKPSKSFKIFGYTEIRGEILGLSLAFNKLTKSMECLTLFCQSGEDRVHGGTQLTKFHLLGEATAASPTSINNHGMMTDAAIGKWYSQTEVPLTSVVHDSEQYVYGYSSVTRSIHKYKIVKGENEGTFSLNLQVKVPGHELGPGFLYLSPDQQYLASVARDGFIQLRYAKNMEIYFTTQCHSYHSEGLKSIMFSLDRQTVLTTGIHDGTLICFTASFDMTNAVQIKAAMEYSDSTITLLNQTSKVENKVLNLMEQMQHLDIKEDHPHPMSKSPTLDTASNISHSSADDGETSDRLKTETWLEMKAAEATKKDNINNAEIKAHLREGIQKLRQTIHLMMIENERVPENERMDQHEFNLNLKEQQRLHAEGEEKVAKVRESIEMKNLANRYLCEVIKEECWDKMAVKGRTLEAFYSGLSVRNYPMRERSKEELELLRQIEWQRTIELMDMKARKDIVETQLKKEEKEEEETEEEDSKEEESVALKGSLTSQYGVVNPYLYKQVDLHTRDQKINQIIFLQDVIYNIKTQFNKEFDATYKQKETEISRVNDRNIRIREIMMQLDMNEDIWVPAMSNDEKPERDFVVQDSEITAERYLTAEQKLKLEEEIRAEQLRLMTAKASDWRERALNDMMGGVLEAKKSDILKLEIPVPYFVNLPEYEWNEEQIKQAKEYNIKERALREEKDKYRKTLESELRKLQASITETTNAFDDLINKLFEKKVRTEMIIYQEELKICNLVFSLQIEEEIQNRNAQLQYLLVEQKDSMGVKSRLVQETRMMVETFREAYDDLVAEDRLLDRGFRKEFFDVNATMVDQLYKLYKRRPKVQMKRTQVATANPFGDQSESSSEGYAHLLAAMDDLDSARFKPEHLDPLVWKRFCDVRRMKVESEQQVKLKAVTLAEMQSFLQRRIDDDEHCNQMIGSYTQDIKNLRQIKSQFQLNLMIQLVLKQGQVEVLGDDFILDYSSSLLLNKSVVEDLNNTIQLLGEKKVVIMVECKDFKKGIAQLEWEYKKMLMQVDDLHNKIRNILKFRITKQAQMYLREDNYETQVNQHLMIMERSAKGQEKFHGKVILQKEDDIRKLKKQISQLKQDMKVMDQLLKEQQISVSERQHVQEMTTMVKPEDALGRFTELMQHRRLIELTRAQAEDITVLRNELEKQRMRTFPVLTEKQEQIYN